MGARPGLAPAPAKNLGTAIALGLFSVGVHLLVNALGSHGYFRDELYYLACARHVSTGYVDQPPLSILILAGASLLLGTSVFAIRIVPAITSGLSVIVLCLLVRRMGGGRAAMVLAALSFLASPLLLGAHTYYSMNGLDVLFWLLAAYALLRIVDQPTLPAWLWLGAIIGVGLLNKISVLWLIAGVGMAVLLTGLRRQLRLPGPYLAGLLALLIFAPYIVWNLRHGLPHLEFLHNATEGKYSSLTRFRFLTDQWLDMNPATFLVSLPGLWWCLLDRDGRRYRALGVVFLTVLAVLMANPHTKAEYMGAAYPMVFACGGIAISGLAGRWRAIAVTVIAALLVLMGAALAPLAMPILPVQDYVRYAKALGVAPSTHENLKVSVLPQFFADMNGW